MANINTSSQNEPDSNSSFLSRFKNATYSVPYATSRLLEIYQLQSNHTSYIVLRNILYSEVRLYLEKIHPRTLSLVDTIRYIITTMQEAAYFGFDQLLDKLGEACQRAETDARQLINSYNSEAARLNTLRASIMDQKLRRFPTSNLSSNISGVPDKKLYVTNQLYATNQLSDTSTYGSISEYPNSSYSQSPSVSQYSRPTSTYFNQMNPPISQYSAPTGLPPPYFSQTPPVSQYVGSNFTYSVPSNTMYSAVPPYPHTAGPTPVWSDEMQLTPYGYPSANQTQTAPQMNLDVQYGTGPTLPIRKKTNDWKKIVPNGVKSRLSFTSSSKETRVNEADEIGVLESTFEVVAEALQSMQELVQSMWGFASEVLNQVETGCFPPATYGYQGRREVLSYAEVLGVGKYVVEECDNLRAARLKIWENLHAIEDEVSDDFRMSWESYMAKGGIETSDFIS